LVVSFCFAPFVRDAPWKSQWDGQMAVACFDRVGRSSWSVPKIFFLLFFSFLPETLRFAGTVYFHVPHRESFKPMDGQTGQWTHVLAV
jgi:hypothetical protein